MNCKFKVVWIQECWYSSQIFYLSGPRLLILFDFMAISPSLVFGEVKQMLIFVLSMKSPRSFFFLSRECFFCSSMT